MYIDNPAIMNLRLPSLSPNLPTIGVNGVCIIAKPEKDSPSQIPDAPKSRTKTGSIGTTIPRPPAITNMDSHNMTNPRILSGASSLRSIAMI